MTSNPLPLPPPPRVRGYSLRARLLWGTGLGAALVVGGALYLQTRIVEDTVEAEAIEAAKAAALGVAAELADRDPPLSARDLEDLLSEFSEAVPSLRSLSLARYTDGVLRLEASTDAVPPGRALELAEHAAERHELVVSHERQGAIRLVAVPLERDRRLVGAVVASLSMDILATVRAKTRLAAFVFAPAGILILVALIDVLARRLVHAPFANLLETMHRAAAGELYVRARVERPDEIGVLATGLNGMLDRLSGWNAALREEVRRATETLQERNRQLAESAQRLFAARRELARSEQLALTGQVAASVAHQIGTPLNLISGYVQMTLEELPPQSSARGRLYTVQEQIGRVTAIVQGLLDQARTPVLRLKEAVPAALVAGVCELARPTLEAAGITLRVELAPNLPHLRMDVGQMEQVLLNLISNSVDAMAGGGELRVGVAVAGADVEFVVSDSGTGIPADDAAHIFDPLFTTKRRGKGTGLGLTIARDVVAAHGGSIRVDSQEGTGTTVSVRVPALAA